MRSNGRKKWYTLKAIKIYISFALSFAAFFFGQCNWFNLYNFKQCCLFWISNFCTENVVMDFLFIIFWKSFWHCMLFSLWQSFSENNWIYSKSTIYGFLLPLLLPSILSFKIRSINQNFRTFLVGSIALKMQKTPKPSGIFEYSCLVLPLGPRYK